MTDDEGVEYARGALALLRKHHGELRAKCLLIDDMIRDFEEQLEAVRVVERSSET